MRLIMQALPADQIKHSYDVKCYVDALTAILSRSSPYSELIRVERYDCFGSAAYYHDIGKAWIAPEILTKPGKLTGVEISAIRKHTLFAEELFKSIQNGTVSGLPEYLMRPAHDAAVYHHEWFNGKGYPYGIGEDKIPLIARITSICDVYDAITSDRPYRKARSHNYACGEIKKSAGTQFDPGLVKIFLEHEAEVFDLLISLNTMSKCC
ncbi:MAG: HD domain-containing protein [Clostridia bacterium]|nr:HD domain-containing protein [Clostridia bacterium]